MERRRERERGRNPIPQWIPLLWLQSHVNCGVGSGKASKTRGREHFSLQRMSEEWGKNLYYVSFLFLSFYRQTLEVSVWQTGKQKPWLSSQRARKSDVWESETKDENERGELKKVMPQLVYELLTSPPTPQACMELTQNNMPKF